MEIVSMLLSEDNLFLGMSKYFKIKFHLGLLRFVDWNKNMHISFFCVFHLMYATLGSLFIEAIF